MGPPEAGHALKHPSEGQRLRTSRCPFWIKMAVKEIKLTTQSMIALSPNDSYFEESKIDYIARDIYWRKIDMAFCQ